jgi:hypothetical protein
MYSTLGSGRGCDPPGVYPAGLLLKSSAITTSIKHAVVSAAYATPAIARALSVRELQTGLDHTPDHWPTNRTSSGLPALLLSGQDGLTTQ